MAMSRKRPRRPGTPGTDEFEVKKVILGRTFSEFDLPEVDRIVEGRRFQNIPTISSSTCTNNLTINVNDKETIDDHISQLPKEILQFIISLLTVREGARTSILSTSWKNLWSESFSCLDFNFANMTGLDCPKFIDEMSLVNERLNFTRRVDQLLQACPSLELDALRVSFVLGRESTTHIDEWMKLAAAQRVKELQLDFSPFGYLVAVAVHKYKFHLQGSNSSLNHLLLKWCIFEFPQDLKGFTSLVSMTLEYVTLTEDVVQTILSDCSSLEWLSLIRCRFMDSPCLKFVGLSLLLKHLHISYDGDSDVRKIDLHDINLLSFELDGRIKTLSIKNASHLTRLVLAQNSPVEILTSVPYIETLFLTRWFKESVQHCCHVSTLPRLYVFNNLKRLVFLAKGDTPDLLQFVYLLETCPLLQKLELDMGISQLRHHREIEKLTKMISRPGSPHTNLKEIDIYGFEGFPDKIELSKYLLKKAIFLEKMIIYTATRRYHGNGKWVLTENTVNQGRMSLKKAHKLLKKDASSSTSLYLGSLNDEGCTSEIS